MIFISCNRKEWNNFLMFDVKSHRLWDTSNKLCQSITRVFNLKKNVQGRFALTYVSSCSRINYVVCLSTTLLIKSSSSQRSIQQSVYVPKSMDPRPHGPVRHKRNKVYVHFRNNQTEMHAGRGRLACCLGWVTLNMRRAPYIKVKTDGTDGRTDARLLHYAYR